MLASVPFHIMKACYALVRPAMLGTPILPPATTFTHQYSAGQGLAPNKETESQNLSRCYSLERDDGDAGMVEVRLLLYRPELKEVPRALLASRVIMKTIIKAFGQ